MQCLDDDIIYRINDHDLVEEMNDMNTNSDVWKNILIKYFYDEEYTDEELDSIQNIQYFNSSTELFYIIPLLILCIEYAIEKALN